MVLFSLEPLNLSSGLSAAIPPEEQIQIRRCFYQGASVAPLGTSHLRDTGSANVPESQRNTAGPSRDGLSFRTESWATESGILVTSLLFC